MGHQKIVYGFVGIFFKINPDFLCIIILIATNRLRQEELLAGGGRRRRRTEEASLSQLPSQVRRSLSLVSFRVTARSILDRLEVLLRGPVSSQEEELEGLGVEKSEPGAEGTRSRSSTWEGSEAKGGILPAVNHITHLREATRKKKKAAQLWIFAEPPCIFGHV